MPRELKGIMSLPNLDERRMLCYYHGNPVWEAKADSADRYGVIYLFTTTGNTKKKKNFSFYETIRMLKMDKKDKQL